MLKEEQTQQTVQLIDNILQYNPKNAAAIQKIKNDLTSNRGPLRRDIMRALGTVLQYLEDSLQKKAIETNQKIQALRPNNMKVMPWEKNQN